MRTFKDNADRTWTVAVNVTAVKRVRALLDIDLYAVINDGIKGLAAIVSDPVKLADVLYVLCQEEADKRQVSDEDFGRSLAGDAIFRAADAFVEAVIDFFPDARARATLTKVVEKGRVVRERLLDHAEQVVDGIDLEREVRTLIASFGNSPDSSESTPGR